MELMGFVIVSGVVNSDLCYSSWDMLRLMSGADVVVVMGSGISVGYSHSSF